VSRLMLSAFTFAACLGIVVTVSAQDPLSDARARQAIAVQKLQGQVKDAIEQSRKLDAQNAKFLLQGVKREVEDSRDLLPTERAQLLQQLNAQLRGVQENGRAKQIIEDQKPLRDPPMKYKPMPVDPRTPGGVSDVAKKYIAPGKTAADLHAELIREREKNLQRINEGIEKAAVPTDRDITLAPDHKERMARRAALTGPQMTKQEVALLKALNSTMSIDYNNEKFKAVLNHLQDKTGINLIMDENSVRELNLDYDDPVNFKVQKATVRTIIKKILGDKGLTYIIKEGHLQVMTPKRAAEHTVVRSYPIDDLITPNQMQMMFGPFAQQAAMMQNAQQIINLIQLTVDPAYWQPNGPGSIVFYPGTKSLLIRASSEMHYQLAQPGMFGR
jgi:hypothetical protein